MHRLHLFTRYQSCVLVENSYFLLNRHNPNSVLAVIFLQRILSQYLNQRYLLIRTDTLMIRLSSLPRPLLVLLDQVKQELAFLGLSLPVLGRSSMMSQAFLFPLTQKRVQILIDLNRRSLEGLCQLLGNNRPVLTRHDQVDLLVDCRQLFKKYILELLYFLFINTADLLDFIQSYFGVWRAL